MKRRRSHKFPNPDTSGLAALALVLSSLGDQSIPAPLLRQTSAAPPATPNVHSLPFRSPQTEAFSAEATLSLLHEASKGCIHILQSQVPLSLDLPPQGLRPSAPPRLLVHVWLASLQTVSSPRQDMTAILCVHRLLHISATGPQWLASLTWRDPLSGPSKGWLCF